MDHFTITTINPLTSELSVTFTVDGQDYTQAMTLPIDTNLNTILAQKLLDLKQTLEAANKLTIGQAYQVEQDGRVSAMEVSPVQIDPEPQPEPVIKPEPEPMIQPEPLTQAAVEPDTLL